MASRLRRNTSATYLYSAFMQQHYDYIITGAGCAGLSLLYNMMQHDYFSNKKILLIDKQNKNNNDRTWCFWEKQPGLFEKIVFHRWKQIDFYSNEFSARFDLEPYEYKMIRGINLYSTVLNAAQHHSNIEIIIDDIINVQTNENSATVKTKQREFTADYVFNSIIFNNWKEEALAQKKFVLLQHFKGWLIETVDDIFDDRIATFMDFRVDQNKGTTFMYVLPVAKNKALIEYTLFSQEILQHQEYEAALKKYIGDFITTKKYSILHSEFGVIPMTNYSFPKGDKRQINIGTAGSQTKASSGYTFQFIQKQTAKIVKALLYERDPLLIQPAFQKRFNLYDSVLLDVLKNKKMSGDKLFTQLFKNNSPQSILKFLDNETSISEELKIMSSVSLKVFLPATIQQLVFR